LVINLDSIANNNNIFELLSNQLYVFCFTIIYLTNYKIKVLTSDLMSSF
jgi:hypothetical protein